MVRCHCTNVLPTLPPSFLPITFDFSHLLFQRPGAADVCVARWCDLQLLVSMLWFRKDPLLTPYLPASSNRLACVHQLLKYEALYYTLCRNGGMQQRLRLHCSKRKCIATIIGYSAPINITLPACIIYHRPQNVTRRNGAYNYGCKRTHGQDLVKSC